VSTGRRSASQDRTVDGVFEPFGALDVVIDLKDWVFEDLDGATVDHDWTPRWRS
jgi:hypothetical protein